MDQQLVPAERGLDVSNSGGREIAFGRARLGVLETVSRLEGAMPREVRCNIGQSAFRTRSGFLLIFEEGRFVGWSLGAEGRGKGCSQ
ncbi:MAG: hypothetical protein AAF919_06775 [Pseudomonadota bacterium]